MLSSSPQSNVANPDTTVWTTPIPWSNPNDPMVAWDQLSDTWSIWSIDSTAQNPDSPHIQETPIIQASSQVTVDQLAKALETLSQAFNNPETRKIMLMLLTALQGTDDKSWASAQVSQQPWPWATPYEQPTPGSSVPYATNPNSWDTSEFDTWWVAPTWWDIVSPNAPTPNTPIPNPSSSST